MKQKNILLITAMMALALLGIIIMQAYWITNSIRVNEQQFEKNVFAAINAVASRIEQQEIDNTTQSFYRNMLAKDKMYEHYRAQENLDEELMSTFDLESFFNSEPEALPQELSKQVGRDEVMRQLEIIMAKRVMSPLPVSERIELSVLDELLVVEFRNRGVILEFDYGIFDTRQRAFVITQQYNCPDGTLQQLDNLEPLKNSPFRVPLFPADFNVPGYLMVHFPGLSSYIWRSVWPTLMGTVLFTGIVIYSFAYTVFVIFRQKKLSEIKTDFINNMTHEFKTPIATISLAVDSIVSPSISQDPAKVKRFADIIKAENRRMNSQVEKVLQMALLDRNQIDVKLRHVNVHNLLEKATEHMSLQVDKRGGTIIAEYGAKSPILLADETHLSNVFHNLLDNANKYSPDAPDIAVRTVDTDSNIEIHIEDKGIGMNAEDKKRIFDKFFRVHTGNRHDVKGFGLGLSYVKKIVDLHKGTIQVKSEPEKGSKFILTFPKNVKISQKYSQ